MKNSGSRDFIRPCSFIQYKTMALKPGFNLLSPRENSTALPLLIHGPIVAYKAKPCDRKSEKPSDPRSSDLIYSYGGWFIYVLKISFELRCPFVQLELNLEQDQFRQRFEGI